MVIDEQVRFSKEGFVGFFLGGGDCGGGGGGGDCVGYFVAEAMAVERGVPGEPGGGGGEGFVHIAGFRSGRGHVGGWY